MVALSHAPTREELILSHQGMARATALAFARRFRIPADDACQEAYVALVLAADRYDPRRGASFFTYAVWVIRGALTSAHKKEYRHQHPVSIVERTPNARGSNVARWGRQSVVELDVPAGEDESRVEIVSALPSPEDRVTQEQLMRAAQVALESAIRARKKAGRWRGKVDKEVLETARRML